MKERDPAEPKRPPLGQNHADEVAPDAILREDPVRLVYPNLEHLHGPEEVAYEADELVVVCLVRDGRPYVKSFVEHYASMGAKHLFFLDNGSTDGTVEALKGYDNVTVLRSTLPYKEHKYLFKQYLIERFGKKDRWCLCVDIDELFDYPYSGVVGLGSLLRYLNEGSYTAVVAQMLDMFPEEPLSEAASEEDEPLKERHRFYDASGISRISIKKLPRLRNNMLESDEVEAFRGGIRQTVFGTKPTLTKFPLMFSDGKVKPIDGSAHWVDNARVADLTCVLFHYKFLDGYFHKQAAQAVLDEHLYDNSVEYKKYFKILDSTLSLQVKLETSKEIENVDDLVENGFLAVSEEYMVLVYEEEKPKKGGRAPQRGELGRPEDEAAFRRAKAEAKVQGLKARRLEQQLEELRAQKFREQNRRLEKLRQQNRREVQELRGQHQRRIERLARRLARTKKRARKKNRALANQLRTIRASRSWRLLNKLARLRARVLRRNPSKRDAS